MTQEVRTANDFIIVEFIEKNTTKVGSLELDLGKNSQINAPIMTKVLAACDDNEQGVEKGDNIFINYHAAEEIIIPDFPRAMIISGKAVIAIVD